MIIISLESDAGRHKVYKGLCVLVLFTIFTLNPYKIGLDKMNHHDKHSISNNRFFFKSLTITPLLFTTSTPAILLTKQILIKDLLKENRFST